jgi:hypothetical protein
MMKKTLTALALTLVAGSMIACGGEAPATNNANANKANTNAMAPAANTNTAPAANANTMAPATNANTAAPATNANTAKPMNANAGEKKAEPAPAKKP